MKAIFVKLNERVAKASGNAFQIVEISNGLQSKEFFVPKEASLDALRKLEKGDEVFVEFATDPFEDEKIRLTSISS